MKKKICLILMTVFIIFSIVPLPIFAEETAGGSIDLNIQAENAIIIDVGSNLVLYSKNPDDKVYCGFLPRLMTCVLLAESGEDINTIVEVPSNIEKLTPQKSSANLRAGDKISLGDLMTAVLIGNAQEACITIAYYLSDGDIKAFVEKMNRRASEIGAENTVFSNVTGYYAATSPNETTARDAAKITAYALSLNYILEKSNISVAILKVNGKDRTLYTKNSVTDKNSSLYHKKASGLALHGDTQIGSSMACVTSDKSTKFVSIAISSAGINSTFSDIKKMLDFSLNEYEYKELLSPNTPLYEIKVKLGKDRDHIVLINESAIQVSLPKSIDTTQINKVFYLNDQVEAPIKKGAVMGSVTLEYNGIVYGASNLVAQTSVDLDIIESYTEQISTFFKNKAVWIVIISVIALVAFYILLTFVKNRRRINEQKLKRRDRVNFK